MGRIMTDANTVNHLFSLAITAENAAEAMYLVLAQRFSSYVEVAQFWREMAHAETLHARVLERMRTRLDSTVLNSAVDEKVLRQAQEALRHEVVAAACAVTDLEDAYQLAHEIENSEINTVFEFLVITFPENPATGEFLREQLQIHARKLTTAFPVPYGDITARRAALPVDRF
jgi:rubrerythrin